MKKWFTLEKESQQFLNTLKDIIPLGIPWWSSGYNLASSLLGPWVRFLVRELRFTTSVVCATTTKK